MLNNIILGLQENYNTNNIYELCDCLNIKIIKVNKFNPILLGDNSLYIREYLYNEIIFIRDDLPPSYEKFYLNHELGHALLHLNIKDTALPNTYKIENEANIFAIKLLNLKFDEISLKNMTIEQITSLYELPPGVLNKLVNL